MRGVGMLALLMLPFILWMNSLAPDKSKIPQGYSSTIIAFELINNQTELEEVLTPLTSEEMSNLDRLNYVDFGFMIVYSLFMSLFAYGLHRMKESRLTYILIIIPLFICIADIYENINLLHLTELYRSSLWENITKVITQLKWSTWTKWYLLAVQMSGLGAAILWRVRSWERFLALLLVIPLILSLFTLFVNFRMINDLLTQSIFFAFLVLILFCFSYQSTAPSKN